MSRQLHISAAKSGCALPLKTAISLNDRNPRGDRAPGDERLSNKVELRIATGASYSSKCAAEAASAKDRHRNGRDTFQVAG